MDSSATINEREMQTQSKRLRIPVANTIDSAGLAKKRALSRPETVIKIVSASYGPSEGRRLVTGEISNDDTARIPFTRDVTHFLRALLVARKLREGDESDNDCTSNLADTGLADTIDGIPGMDLVRLTGRQQRNFIPIMDGQSMNAVFGDPCPGTSKRLRVRYVIFESMEDFKSRAAESEVHTVEFAEHERVVLRRRTTLHQDEAKLRNAIVPIARKQNEGEFFLAFGNNEEEDKSTLNQARQIGRSQLIADITETFDFGNLPVAPKLNPGAESSNQMQAISNGLPLASSNSLISVGQKKWRLRSATSEIVLPIILPFLEVRERVLCQLLCKVWRLVVKNWGVAQAIDVNDEAFPNFTREFLRGILAHSHHSLQSLLLNQFQDLRQEDLHPALPHLRKLRSLDISRCTQLDDNTMHLIANYLKKTLEVLYLKGLRKVTDNGLISICRSCCNLKVLEISNIPITDVGAICIGESLPQLNALYARDNYMLTNKSIDVITEKCTHLTELTLWGCNRISHLSFAGENRSVVCGNLVLLNLWGCYSLLDDAAVSLGSMNNLRSLIVSECHRLTDIFLFGIAEKMPALNHLCLRYCKRITDDGVNAVANSMRNLYSLDLSFCTRITSASIIDLLEQRHELLLELRLQNCTQLDIIRAAMSHESPMSSGDGSTGRAILNIIRSLGERLALNMLDVRNCGVQNGNSNLYASDDPFVSGMECNRYKQLLPGLFLRPTSSNATVKLRLGKGIGCASNSCNA